MRPLFRCALLLAVVVVAPSVAPSVATGQRQAVVPSGMAASATLTPGIRQGMSCIRRASLAWRAARRTVRSQTQTKKALDNVRAVVEAGGEHHGQRAQMHSVSRRREGFCRNERDIFAGVSQGATGAVDCDRRCAGQPGGASRNRMYCRDRTITVTASSSGNGSRA